MASSAEYKRCIACAEQILTDAQLCKHCKTDQRDKSFRSDPTSSEPKSAAESSSVESQSSHQNSGNKQFFLDEDVEKGVAKPRLPKAVIIGTISFGLIALLFGSGFFSSSQFVEDGLSSNQSQRLNNFLNSLSDGYDNELRTVATCVSIHYDELNNTFLDPNARSVPMARVQDCVESRNSKMTCGQADDGTGPICGIAGSRTGYSIASVFGAMIGQGDPQESSSKSSTGGESNGSSDSQQSGMATGEPSDEPTYSETPVPAKVAWVPTAKNIKACSLDYYDDTCPHEYSNHVVEAKNKFGVNAQELVQKMISAGICKEWPKENKVWQRPTIENACLGERDGFYVATGDVEIWGLIYINPYGEVYAAGDGWVVYAVYTSLEDMQIVANLLGGIAWQRGY